MDALTREERLGNLLDFEEEDFARQIEWFLHKRKRVGLGSILLNIARIERTRAIHAYFIKNNIVALKQHCHLATKLSLASVGQNGGANFEVATDFLYALLSDNLDAISALAQVEVPELLKERNNPLNSRSYVYMLQLAIRGEDENLREMIAKVSKNGRKPVRIESQEGKDFFSLLLKRDQVGLEECIGKHASIRSPEPRIENFMSFQGALEAKLCWFRDIPVNIDSPWVQMELMPMRPLERYDDVYDFLKPGWVPPPQGVIADLSRRLTKAFGKKSR
ncbi:Imm49 family immunity protein [Burkholderia sp. LMU1-1-1.1]|uniref:Imm49 family immunity protein n=1 Tax=Burkholderia sp. LMU1-1-1.1 TaxID=3135266 RepID=UPI0034482D33